MNKSKKIIFNNSLPANVAAAALIVVIAILSLITTPYGVAQKTGTATDGYAYTASFQSHGSMLSSSSASVPAITETPQAAPAAKGGGSFMFVKLSASSLLKQRDIENIYRKATVISGEAKSASLEPLKRYFVFAIREIII